MPTPHDPGTPGSDARGNAIARYAALINSQYPPDTGTQGVNLGDDYISYMYAHTDKSPGQVYKTLEFKLQEFKDVPTLIAAGIKGQGKVVSEIVTGTGQVLQNPLQGWLSSLGGMIGSGIESGLVAFFKDLWAVIEGPLLILLGAAIAIAVLAIYFKNDITSPMAMAKGG